MALSTGTLAVAASTISSAESRPTAQQRVAYKRSLATAELCTYRKADELVLSDVRSDAVAGIAYDGCKPEFIRSEVLFLEITGVSLPLDRIDAIFESSRGIHQANLTRYVVEKRKALMAQPRARRGQPL